MDEKVFHFLRGLKGGSKGGSSSSSSSGGRGSSSSSGRYSSSSGSSSSSGRYSSSSSGYSSRSSSSSSSSSGDCSGVECYIGLIIVATLALACFTFHNQNRLRRLLLKLSACVRKKNKQDASSPQANSNSGGGIAEFNKAVANAKKNLKPTTVAANAVGAPDESNALKDGDTFYYDPWRNLAHGKCVASFVNGVLVVTVEGRSTTGTGTWRCISAEDTLKLLAGETASIIWDNKGGKSLEATLTANGSIQVMHGKQPYYFLKYATPAFETYAGDFDVQYMDRGNKHSGKSKIQLTANGEGMYNISGNCSDVDGSAKITEGFANHDGVAWWIEETMTGSDKGLRVLTEGEFNFDGNNFVGKWRSNTGINGTYVKFQSNNAQKAFISTVGGGESGESGPPTLEEQLAQDLVPTVETPVVAAAPVIVQAAVPEPELYILPTVSAVVVESSTLSDQNPTTPQVYVPNV